MTKKRDVLVHLSREELLAAADRLGVDLPERRAREPIEEALAASPEAAPVDVLVDPGPERLTEPCRAQDARDHGAWTTNKLDRRVGSARSRPPAPGIAPRRENESTAFEARKSAAAVRSAAARSAQGIAVGSGVAEALNPETHVVHEADTLVRGGDVANVDAGGVSSNPRLGAAPKNIEGDVRTPPGSSSRSCPAVPAGEGWQ